MFPGGKKTLVRKGYRKHIVILVRLTANKFEHFYDIFVKVLDYNSKYVL